MSKRLEHYHSIPNRALNALQNDSLRPICTGCGTQYPGPRDRCVICEDPRQFVAASGQTWTDLAELGQTRVHSLLQDEEDSRITFIQTEPPFAINQTPILIETAEGSYIWDCAAFLSPHLIAHLSDLKRPLKAIVISHPHFFASCLTWSRALGVPLYLCGADKEWYQRLEDITDDDQVTWFEDRLELGKGVQVIQCGGHFDGSSILHWDRLVEPEPPKDDLPTKPTPVSGVVFTADTIMVTATQSRFTFIWSVPNMIPLRPRDAMKVASRLDGLSFSQATSTWPKRFIRADAKRILKESVEAHLNACGWKLNGKEMVPLEYTPEAVEVGTGEKENEDSSNDTSAILERLKLLKLKVAPRQTEEQPREEPRQEYEGDLSGRDIWSN